MTKLYTVQEEVFIVGQSPDRVAEMLNAAHARGEIAVTFTRHGRTFGIMIEHIVRWEAVR